MSPLHVVETRAFFQVFIRNVRVQMLKRTNQFQAETGQSSCGILGFIATLQLQVVLN